MKGPQVKGLTKENLIKLYVNDENASLESVGKILGCNRETVRRWIRRYGLAAKSSSRENKSRKAQNKPMENKEWLMSRLKKKTAKDISKELNTSHQDVLYWTHKHGLINANKSVAIKESLAKRYPKGRFGESASNWRGGRRKIKGYVYIYNPDHPKAGKRGAVQEHRLVMEEHLGRYLKDNEIVHHKNGVKDDNRLENLEVKERGQHVSEHFKASHEVVRLRKRVAELEKELEKYK